MRMTTRFYEIGRGITLLPKIQQLTALRARLESEYQTTNHLRFYSMAYLPSYFFL